MCMYVCGCLLVKRLYKHLCVCVCVCVCVCMSVLT